MIETSSMPFQAINIMITRFIIIIIKLPRVHLDVGTINDKIFQKDA